MATCGERRPRAGSGPGGRSEAGGSAGVACEVSQFWQVGQCRLQHAVAAERIGVPGRKCNRGFFSTGSTCTAQGCP